MNMAFVISPYSYLRKMYWGIPSHANNCLHSSISFLLERRQTMSIASEYCIIIKQEKKNDCSIPFFCLSENIPIIFNRALTENRT